MKLIICGGRGYILTNEDIAWLDKIHAAHSIKEVISGGAAGADRGGEAWAMMRGIPIRQFRPQWHIFSRAGGPIRNEAMAQYADAYVAFPGGSGTADMVRRAKKHYLITFKRLSDLANQEDATIGTQSEEVPRK